MTLKKLIQRYKAYRLKKRIRSFCNRGMHTYDYNNVTHIREEPTVTYHLMPVRVETITYCQHCGHKDIYVHYATLMKLETP